MPYPRIADFPPMLTTESWHWRRERFPRTEHEFWIGTDEGGVDWLVKMRGGAYAQRECTFARFAQGLGLSCQTAVYLHLSKNAEPLRATEEPNRVQAALYLLPEHSSGLCSEACPLGALREALAALGSDPIEVLGASTVVNALDWPRVDLLACLCGANELSDPLFTERHELVMVDNEQMFSTGPVGMEEWSWSSRIDGSRSCAARSIAFELLRQVAELSDAFLDDCAELPATCRVVGRRDLRRSLQLTRAAARNLLPTA